MDNAHQQFASKLASLFPEFPEIHLIFSIVLIYLFRVFKSTHISLSLDDQYKQNLGEIYLKIMLKIFFAAFNMLPTE